MTFDIGDKVQTVGELYISGAWRKNGLKGKVVDTSRSEAGLITVKFKGIEDTRFIRPEYLGLREKAKAAEPEEAPRPFEVGDSVVFTKTVVEGLSVHVVEGIWAEVAEVIPHSNLVVVEFDDYTTLTVAEDVLASEEDTFAGGEEGEPADPEFVPEESSSDQKEAEEHTPEVVEALNKILARIEEIKTLLTTKPQTEFHIYTSEASLVAPEPGEEPAPEPVFKRAKEVKAGDSLYTEGGAYDKVDRVETKTSGYTSLYGAFGNKIAQVPSGRVVQVLEEVS